MSELLAQIGIHLVIQLLVSSPWKESSTRALHACIEMEKLSQWSILTSFWEKMPAWTSAVSPRSWCTVQRATYQCHEGVHGHSDVTDLLWCNQSTLVNINNQNHPERPGLAALAIEAVLEPRNLERAAVIAMKPVIQSGPHLWLVFRSFRSYRNENSKLDQVFCWWSADPCLWCCLLAFIEGQDRLHKWSQQGRYFIQPSNTSALSRLESRGCMFQCRNRLSESWKWCQQVTPSQPGTCPHCIRQGSDQIGRFHVSAFAVLHQAKSQLQHGTAFQCWVLAMPVKSFQSNFQQGTLTIRKALSLKTVHPPYTRLCRAWAARRKNRKESCRTSHSRFVDIPASKRTFAPAASAACPMDKYKRPSRLAVGCWIPPHVPKQ